MLKFITKVFKNTIPWLIIVFFLYLSLACAIFAIRHPWATDMERFIHIGDALTFKKISYKEMRGEYEK